MKVMEFLPKKAISSDLKGANKQEIISELLDLLISASEVEKKHKNKLMEILLAREALGSTAIGQGIGIPHGKSEHLSKLIAAFGLSRSGVNFDSLDGEPVYLFFLLLAPQDSAGPHLKALARISRLLKDKYFRDRLKAARDEATILKIISQEDERKV
jgi:PTS system nitrogen regulatory IIA component